MKITGNEPVSPVIYEQDNGYGVKMIQFEGSGMTIRQQFAAMAMQGCIASTSQLIEWTKPEEISEKALLYADALIKSLNETPNPNEHNNKTE
jgi:hypothetical protein